MARKKKTPKSSGQKVIARNRKARFDYHIETRIEAGIMLCGSEVKSIRAGNISITEAHAHLNSKGEMYLLNAHIAEYPWANQFNHEPRRKRKLLLHKREIGKLSDSIVCGGMSLIPLSVYFKNGLVKVELGLGKGKKQVDKRESMKKSSAQREMARALRGD